MTNPTNGRLTLIAEKFWVVTLKAGHGYVRFINSTLLLERFVYLLWALIHKTIRNGLHEGLVEMSWLRGAIVHTTPAIRFQPFCGSTWFGQRYQTVKPIGSQQFQAIEWIRINNNQKYPTDLNQLSNYIMSKQIYKGKEEQPLAAGLRTKEEEGGVISSESQKEVKTGCHSSKDRRRKSFSTGEKKERKKREKRRPTQVTMEGRKKEKNRQQVARVYNKDSGDRRSKIRIHGVKIKEVNVEGLRIQLDMVAVIATIWMVRNGIIFEKRKMDIEKEFRNSQELAYLWISSRNAKFKMELNKWVLDPRRDIPCVEVMSYGITMSTLLWRMTVDWRSGTTIITRLIIGSDTLLIALSDVIPMFVDNTLST
ncbi:hypothetical protein LXL04_003180 [Taraxacum kok-saghyz]